MNNKPGQLVVYLVAFAAVFVILFGIRGSASILNPILLAAVITITVSANPRPPDEAWLAGLAVAGAEYLAGCCTLAAGDRDDLLFSNQAGY